MNKYVCIHAHCYQPPRENPWLGEVEVQDSAAPYHDWNERITAECYGPCAQARIVDSEGRIVNLVNTYSRMSFNFGPTLLSWMERHAPRVYSEVLEADRLSRERFGGHGSALAQVYNHMIMPLATDRDKRIQTAWGVEDFMRRYGRDPEGMWLPECAVDTASLEVLADAGIRFVVLAQRQAKRFRNADGVQDSWMDVNGDVDPTAAYAVNLPSGRVVTAFFHDASISADMAFAHLAQNGQALHDRLVQALADEGRGWPQLVNVAADGETFGHHHHGGDMALAWCLDTLEKDPAVELTNYAQYLERYQPVFEVELHENSSWSCVHGIERWRSDCGCNSGGHPGWNQAWRQPLRQAVDWLAGEAQAVFADKGAACLKDPEAALKAYIQVILDRSDSNVADFLAGHAKASDPPPDEATVFKLLEMARMAQLTFTSCGWFFDEISGIEGVQIMQYAACCAQLAEELSGRPIERHFVGLLAKAPSNVLENGAKAYKLYAKPAKTGLRHVAAHAAMTLLFSERPEEYVMGSWKVQMTDVSLQRSSSSALISGECRVGSELTRESQDFVIAALHLGGHQVSCGVDRYQSSDDLHILRSGLAGAFERGDQAGALSILHNRFRERVYTMARLFKDEQRAVLARVMAPTLEGAAEVYRRVFRENLESLKFLSWLHSPLPAELMDAGRHALQHDLEAMFSSGEVDAKALKEAAIQVKRWNFQMDTARLGGMATKWIGSFAEAFEKEPRSQDFLSTLLASVELCLPLGLPVQLWKAQNACFIVSRSLYPELKPQPGNEEWVKAFEHLGRVLRVKVEA